MWVEPTGPFFRIFCSTFFFFYPSLNYHINILPYKFDEKVPLWENVLSSERFLPAPPVYIL